MYRITRNAVINIISFLHYRDYPSFIETSKVCRINLLSTPLQITSKDDINLIKYAPSICNLTLTINNITTANKILDHAVNLTSLTIKCNSYVAVPGNSEFGFIVSVNLNKPYLRDVSIKSTGVLFAEKINAKLDKLVLQIDELPILMHPLPPSLDSLIVTSKTKSKPAIESWMLMLKTLKLKAFSTNFAISNLLKELPNMQGLERLGCVDLKTIGGSMPNLYLFNGHISEDLCKCPKLEFIISSDYTHDIKALQRCSRLKSLEVYCHNSTHILPLMTLTNIEILNISIEKQDPNTNTILRMLTQNMNLKQLLVKYL